VVAQSRVNKLLGIPYIAIIGKRSNAVCLRVVLLVVVVLMMVMVTMMMMMMSVSAFISPLASRVTPPHASVTRLTHYAALRAIKKNEELLLEYGENYWRNMQPEEVNAEAERDITDRGAEASPSAIPLSAAKHLNTNGSF
jgi:hypothetical protein